MRAITANGIQASQNHLLLANLHSAKTELILIVCQIYSLVGKYNL